MKELEYTTKSVPKDKRFCTICGEIKRVHYFEGDSTHCSACCEKMLHTRVHAWSVPVVLVMLLLAAAAVFLLTHAAPYTLSLIRADRALAEDRLSDANAGYAAAVSDAGERNIKILVGEYSNELGETKLPSWTLFESGTRTWVHYIQTYAALYSEYEAATLMQNSLNADVTAGIPSIACLNDAKAAYEEVQAFLQQLDEKYPPDSSEDMPYDEIMAEMTAFADASDSRYIKGYIEYYKAMATEYNSDDPADARVYYDKLLEYLPDEFMTAYTSEGDAAMQAGRYDMAVEAYEAILERNKNYTDAYYRIAEASFMAGDLQRAEQELAHFPEDDPQRIQVEIHYALRRDDLEAAEQARTRARKFLKPEADQIFNNMLANQTISESDTKKLMDYVSVALYDAALSLVQDDVQAAYKSAYDEAFNYAYYYAYISGDSSSMTQPLVNMATLCAALADHPDSVETVSQVLGCDEAVQQVIDGKLTVRDIFVEGKERIL